MKYIQSLYRTGKLRFTLLLSLILSSLAYAAPININSADISEITANLIDIGPAKASAIVEYRELNGPFENPEALLAVKGIGEKTLEKNRDNLLFDEPQTQKSAQIKSQ